MASEADYRLPRTAVPSRYRITIEPDLVNASFAGSVEIDIEILEPLRQLTLNAVDLTPTAASVSVGGMTHAASAELDADRERMTLTVDEELRPGVGVVSIAFVGVLNDDLRGFYRSTYTDEDGAHKTLATTQFESTDARRAFPCWDEPDLKATFDITLVVAEGLMAVSNAREVSREPASDGRIRIRFAETAVMSTYLVAFVIGDLVATPPRLVDGIPLRIVTPPGKLHLADFALDAGAFALDYFATYYDVPYPGDKLDMVAIPDFGFGAMENLGCITFRETALLVDRSTATQTELARVASVIAHEIAHMWFGDLVTMKWWNGVWLNEAFATFAENKCTAAFRPDWKYWLTFATDRSTSQETDALAATRPIEFPVASPAEADGMFDVLTYEKGSSVLRMMEQFLSEETFRAGVSLYLERHSFGNTDNEDLWRALEEVSGQPVGDIMDTWIFQGGYPILDVSRDGDVVTLHQRPFRFIGEGEGSWQVPVLYRSSEGEGRVVVGPDPVSIEVGDELVVDAGGEGFYRVGYDEGLFSDVIDRFEDLDALERYSVLSDAVAELLSGTIPASTYLELIDRVRTDEDKEIWSMALSGIDELDRVIAPEDRHLLQAFVRSLTTDLAEDLGWDPQADESDRTRALRGLILKARGTLGEDADTIATARSIEGAMAADESGIDAEVADAALTITSSHGDIHDFERFLTLSKAARTPQLTVKYLRAAAQVPHPDVVPRILDLVLSGDIRSQDSFWVLALLIGDRQNGVLAWGAITDRWDEVMAGLPPAHRYRILDLLKYRSEPGLAETLPAWFENHPIEGAEKSISQKLEMVKVRSALRAREAGSIGPALRSASPSPLP